jgi:ribonuclease HI
LSKDGEVLAELKECLGNQTNNFAEYMALIKGLEFCRDHGAREVHVRADSEFMIKQLKGEYKVKSEVIIPLFKRAKEVVGAFKLVTFEHVRREQNVEADRLANEALDESKHRF